jgi:hypothetical protein
VLYVNRITLHSLNYWDLIEFLRYKDKWSEPRKLVLVKLE